jgi:hypothetical protein
MIAFIASNNDKDKLSIFNVNIIVCIFQDF